MSMLISAPSPFASTSAAATVALHLHVKHSCVSGVPAADVDGRVRVEIGHGLMMAGAG